MVRPTRPQEKPSGTPRGEAHVPRGDDRPGPDGARLAPGVVLDVGLPVGWVDGLPATALVWAALLSERLADDADWD